MCFSFERPWFVSCHCIQYVTRPGFPNFFRYLLWNKYNLSNSMGILFSSGMFWSNGLKIVFSVRWERNIPICSWGFRVGETWDVIRVHKSAHRIYPIIDKGFIHYHVKTLSLIDILNQLGCSPICLIFVMSHMSYHQTWMDMVLLLEWERNVMWGRRSWSFVFGRRFWRRLQIVLSFRVRGGVRIFRGGGLCLFETEEELELSSTWTTIFSPFWGRKLSLLLKQCL